ncbi:MAG: hypothetical protein AAB423_02950 [Patescibacteria group bacterium]
MAKNNGPSGWVGWVYFGGILMLVASFFQGFLGVVALSKPDFYVVTPERLAVFNYTAWGWGHILVSILLLTAAFSVFAGGSWGRVVGSLVAGLSIVTNLVFLPAYPIWSTAAIVIASLVLYALVVHGDEAKE